jgi:hypothetical protein
MPRTPAHVGHGILAPMTKKKITLETLASEMRKASR